MVVFTIECDNIHRAWEGLDAIAVALSSLAILGYSFVVLILYSPMMKTTQEKASLINNR